MDEDVRLGSGLYIDGAARRVCGLLYSPPFRMVGCRWLRCEEAYNVPSSRNGVMIVVWVNFDDNADTHQVVMAPERAQIQEWFPMNAERIERSLDWLLENNLLLRPRKPLRAIRLDWRDLAQCMGDDSLQPQCDFSDNQYLLVAMVVLLCVRFRCNDPQRIVVILQCDLPRWGAT